MTERGLTMDEGVSKAHRRFWTATFALLVILSPMPTLAHVAANRERCRGPLGIYNLSDCWRI